MRSGKPYGYCTFVSKVQPQTFNSGVEGYFPILIEFDYDHEKNMKLCAGIQ